MTRTALVLLLLCTSVVSATDADPRSLAIPPAETERATELVGQLAGREYSARESAMRELRKLGRLALPTLKETLATATNPEVRLRVQLLLPAAVSADIQAKVDCFLADKDGKFQHDLPGAKAFFSVAGRTDNAKKLFSDMVRSANRELLVNADGPTADLERAYITRRNELGYATNNVVRPGVNNAATAVDMASLLFAEARLPDRGIGVAGPNGTRLTPLLMNYNFQTPLKSLLDNDPHKEVLAAVLQHWMETREQAYSLYSAITFMQRFNLPNALPAARKLISGKAVGNASPIYKANAMGYLARFGDLKTDLPVLEAALDDKSVVTTVFVGGGPGNRQMQVQNRDVALAMAVLMTKQIPTDFGLVNRYGANPPESMKYNYYTYYFEGETPEQSDEKRDAAVKKYKELKAKQPKEKKEKDEPVKK